MPKGLLQEKFQVTADRAPRESREWASFESQRRVASIPAERHYATSEEKKSQTVGGLPSELTDFNAPQSNRMPPGMNIDSQLISPKVSTPYSAAGATDVSNKVDGNMMRKGFSRLPMQGTDDMYTNEHVEEFYGEAKGEDDAGNKYIGYLERNNMLDRN